MANDAARDPDAAQSVPSWTEAYPYAAPNLLSAILLLLMALWVFFGLEEVSQRKSNISVF